MDWTKQGPVIVAPVELTPGRRGRAVLVGPRENPQGAVIIVAGMAGGGVDTRPLDAHLDQLSPAVITEIVCMQERQFGSCGLPKPPFS